MTRALIASLSVAALFVLGSQATQAVTLTFYSDDDTRNGVLDLANELTDCSPNTTDICGETLTWDVGGMADFLTVSGSDGSENLVVIQDIDPAESGLGLLDGTDNIDAGETMTLSFMSPVTISAIEIFAPEAGNTPDFLAILVDSMSLTFNHTNIADGLSLMGTMFDITLDSDLTHDHDDKYGNWESVESRFYLASITFEKKSVPEPGTVLLLGLGLVGFGFARRRIAS